MYKMNKWWHTVQHKEKYPLFCTNTLVCILGVEWSIKILNHYTVHLKLRWYGKSIKPQLKKLKSRYKTQQQQMHLRNVFCCFFFSFFYFLFLIFLFFILYFCCFYLQYSIDVASTQLNQLPMWHYKTTEKPILYK